MDQPHVPFTARADLHVHSRYSDRPSEWVLRRVGAPECFVEPLQVYERAIAAGMNFVTISDHNKIDGALDIAHLPNTYISTEVTTYFPENDAKMHILAIGITEEQFRAIQDLRTDIYALRRFFVAEDIIYSVAHPLFLVNDRLTIDQFEKLLVLFNRFELINGTRDPRATQVVEALLNSLTPQMIDDLANKHGIEPVGPTPHKKLLTAGSDDHSGLYIASAHTVTPHAETVEQFLDHLRHGRHEPAGRSGSSVHLAHCFYQIAYGYYKQRILRDPAGGGSLLGEMLKRLLEPPTQASTAAARVRGYVGGWVWRRRKHRYSATEQLLIEEFATLFNQNKLLPASVNGNSAPRPMTAAEAFETSCNLAHKLGCTFLQRFVDKATGGDLIKCIEAIAAMGPVVAAITPYIAAFKTQHKDEKFIQRVTRHFDLDPSLHTRGPGRCWVTDTFDDVNGVTRTIRTLASAAAQQDRPLTVLTCVDKAPEVNFDLKNFEPVERFPLPEYPQQQVAFPPFMQIIEYIERQRFGEVIISTPGPMGLTALAAAKMLHLRTVGIYHTDFPNYIRMLTDDLALEALTWRYMAWFFDQCDTILVPSEYYRRYLVEHGFTAEKIRVLRRGVDPRRFNPHRRDESFWTRFGGREATTFLYTGRISSEKNVNLLVDAFERLLKDDPSLQLALVGDGPMLTALRGRCKHMPQVLMTGFLEGDDLARAYASADAFVFPSTTDTFGNVVLEAMASGLGAIVSDRGGPQEIVSAHDAGIIVDLSDASQAADRLADAMRQLADDPALRAELHERAKRTAASMSWSAVLDTLWSATTSPQRPLAPLMAGSAQ
ncbi:glycosyltransferase [Planctomycetales bacterium ZRK34]|nr:glycosyltransferase [Planctomycetales bacterium ZRK34]